MRIAISPVTTRPCESTKLRRRGALLKTAATSGAKAACTSAAAPASDFHADRVARAADTHRVALPFRISLVSDPRPAVRGDSARRGCPPNAR